MHVVNLYPRKHTLELKSLIMLKWESCLHAAWYFVAYSACQEEELFQPSQGHLRWQILDGHGALNYIAHMMTTLVSKDDFKFWRVDTNFDNAKIMKLEKGELYE